MLHLRSSNGYQNVFSLNIYQGIYGATINATNPLNNTMALRGTGHQITAQNSVHYINLIDQLTQTEYWSVLGQITYLEKYPRSQQFYLYLDGGKDQYGVALEYHIDISTNGLYDYEIYWGKANATSKTDNRIGALLTTGMAMVHNDNFVNNYFQNSTSGIEPMVIPNAKSYNG